MAISVACLTTDKGQGSIFIIVAVSLRRRLLPQCMSHSRSGENGSGLLECFYFVKEKHGSRNMVIIQAN